MPKFSAIARKSGKPLVKTFTYLANTHVPVSFAVTLEYVPLSVLEEEQDKAKQRVLGSPKRYSDVEDLQQTNRLLESIIYEVLANRVQKITGLTLRKLHALMPVEADLLAAADDVDAEIELDPSDVSPLPSDEQDGEVTSKGQLARQNIATLLKGVPRFQNWLQQVVSDVSFFTAGDLEERRKNL